MSKHDTSDRAAWGFVLGGLAFTLLACFLTWWLTRAGDVWFVWVTAAAVPGLTAALYGGLRLSGYRSFVAWRYLLSEKKIPRRNRIAFAVALGAYVFVGLLSGFSLDLFKVRPLPPAAIAMSVVSLAVQVILVGGILRYSKPALWLWVVGVVLILVPTGLSHLIRVGQLPFVLEWQQEDLRLLSMVLGFVVIGGGVLAGLATFFGALRAFFSFFTTVPIGGVWIGTSALIIVLSVMSGFENDLRDKILGSNAHIQITRNEGDFMEWEKVKAKIDAVPGVVASTPYAVSEVVIAAHNNGMNVIIKGIDPSSVGLVTDLVADIEGKDAAERAAALDRLQPLLQDTRDLSVPQKDHASDALDPAPDDLPTAAEPIDFSDAGAAPSANDAVPAPDVRPPAPDVLDPAPADLVASSDVPLDFSIPVDVPDAPTPLDPDAVRIDVVDYAQPVLPRRVQSLPGVLVGRELVKQTHLYTGEEVRVVSPLSDPSNPDATGTPIPFNRDYRVAGVFFTGMYEYDLKYVYVTLESLQDFLDRGETIDGIEVRVTDADDTERMTGELRRALGSEYRVVDWRELNQSLFAALKLEKIAMFLVLGIVILVASFAIVGNLTMAVVEKGRQIALLKTLGASDAGVMQLFAIQGLMIGIIGTMLGVAFGLAVCLLGKKYGLPLDPNVYYIDRLPIHIDPASVLGTLAAGIGMSILATLYPANVAARVRPSAGMRH